MKSILKSICLLLLIALPSLSNAQDIITLKGGDEVKAKVTEVESDAIKYKKFDNQNGPVYSFPKSEVFMIQYENGTKDIISTATPPPAPEQKIAPPAQTNKQAAPQKNYDSGKNSKYKREIVGGGVMTGLGIPLVIAGVPLVIAGANLSNSYTYSTAYLDDGTAFTLWMSGAVILVAGTAFTIAGPIQLSKGIKHRREFKYGRAYLDFKPISNKYCDTHFRTLNNQKLGAITINF